MLLHRFMLNVPFISSQYYDSTFPSLKEQQKFEEKLFSKIDLMCDVVTTPIDHTSTAEIVLQCTGVMWICSSTLLEHRLRMR